MADRHDSTTTPSRRQFFSSAVGAGVAAAAPPIFVVAGSSALAASCDWAVRYHDRIAVEGLTANWSTEALRKVCDPLDVAVERAISEASSDLGDVQAKCRLLLKEIDIGDEEMDRNHRFTLAVLQDILKLRAGHY